jgi:hypothetical protein
MTSIGKVTFNIDGTIVHSNIYIPFNCINLSFKNPKWLGNLMKKYYRL